MNIVITGFMGTGKTTVGKILAKKLGWEFFDTDDMIEKDVGLRISEIFNNKGEPYFRNVETKAIKLVSLLENVIISCGGGVVCNSENMDELEKKGIIVNLKAAPEKILELTSKTKERPLLDVQDPLAKIKELLDKRKECYRRCALSIDIDDLTAEQVADKILSHLKIESKIKN